MSAARPQSRVTHIHEEFQPSPQLREGISSLYRSAPATIQLTALRDIISYGNVARIPRYAQELYYARKTLDDIGRKAVTLSFLPPATLRNGDQRLFLTPAPEDRNYFDVLMQCLKNMEIPDVRKQEPPEINALYHDIPYDQIVSRSGLSRVVSTIAPRAVTAKKPTIIDRHVMYPTEGLLPLPGRNADDMF